MSAHINVCLCVFVCVCVAVPVKCIQLFLSQPLQLADTLRNEPIAGDKLI